MTTTELSVCAVITGAITFFSLGGWVGSVYPVDGLTLQKEVVTRGYMHRVITDPATGKTELKWVDKPTTLTHAF